MQSSIKAASRQVVVQQRQCVPAATERPPAPPLPGAPSIRLSRAALLKGALLAAGSTMLAPAQLTGTALAADDAAVAVAAGAAPAAAAAAALAAPATLSSVMLRTLADCELAVSVYPTFSYDAAGGGGAGRVTRVREDGILEVEFDPSR